MIRDKKSRNKSLYWKVFVNNVTEKLVDKECSYSCLRLEKHFFHEIPNKPPSKSPTFSKISSF